MSKKIGLHVGGRRFDVDVEDKFADFLQKQMIKDFNMEGNNDIKILLQAYVRKNHDLYMQNEKIEEMLAKIEK
ncbi:MAG TPA: hypothetical protein EYH11_02970 [Sulfurimonas autotrophica]|nr:hypothetical protein [Sulfurimonas autotrophica]